MTIIVWLILCLIWGTTWIFIKLGLGDLPPISFATLRFILAALIIGIIIKIKRLPFPNRAREWKLIFLTGFMQFALNYSAVFWSEQYISSGLAAVLQATITVFGLILAWIFLPNEKINLLKIIAILIGIGGVVIIFAEQLQINDRWAFAASAAIVAGAYFAAQASILVKSKGGNIHPASLVFGQIVCALPFLTVYSLVKEGNPLNFNWSARTLICLAYLSIFGTVVAFWLYYWLLNKVESTKAMMISLITPLIAVIVGAITLDEKLPAQTFFGGSLIIVSIGLIILKRKSANTSLGSAEIEKSVT